MYVLRCVIPIEDNAELRILDIPNLVTLEARCANLEGTGEITIRELIRTALRMRPNRIIVGEVRGAEAIDMLHLIPVMMEVLVPVMPIVLRICFLGWRAWC